MKKVAALNASWELVDETSNVKAYSAGCLADANKRFVPQPRGGQFSYQFLIQLLFFPGCDIQQYFRTVPSSKRWTGRKQNWTFVFRVRDREGVMIGRREKP